MTEKDPAPIVIPQVSVNEDTVTISSIAVAPGARVGAGDIIFSVSTSKADMDVDAPAGGHFWPAVEVGAIVAVGATAGYLTATAERPAALDQPKAARPAPRATDKAVALAAKLGVDLAGIEQRGIIRESDVEAFAARGASRKPAAASAAAATQGPFKSSGRGRVDAGFLAAIGRTGSGFAQLSSELKVLLYRKHGAEIADDVTFAPGAWIHAEEIVVGRGCGFGANTVIRAQTFEVGVGGLFGHDNDILCRHLKFGDMLYLVNRVLIGQGGAFNEEAELSVGHSCLISSDCMINTACRVSLGDRSCLSPRVSIFTHSHWQNVLEGYRATFAPVVIGNDVWITGNCIVTPGAVVEDGAQALANSVITGHIPERTIVSGVPAAPVAKVRGGLKLEEKDRLMRGIWPEVERAVRLAGLDPRHATYSIRPSGGDAPVQVSFGPWPSEGSGTRFDLESYRVTGPNTPLADEVRNVLRKHGIRFEPHTWRYRADVGRFNA